jgi:GMP synthase-like glutamine amidotransferase
MKKIFIIQHTASTHPGKIILMLERLGHSLEILKLFENPQLKAPDNFDGVIILGGGMSVNDENQFAWIKPECKFIRELVKKEIPLLGVCLGAQMIAKAHGAIVKKNSSPEFGWSDIRPTEFALKDKFYNIKNSLDVYQWHDETFDIPLGAIRLSYSQACANQAYKLGKNCYGIQYHPETDYEMINDWLYKEDGEGDINEVRSQGHTQYVQPSELHLEMAKKYQAGQHEHLLQLLKIFE